MNTQDWVIRDLHMPPAARTAHSVALIWSVPEDTGNVTGYRVRVNGRLVRFCEPANCTLEALAADTDYEIRVAAVSRSGETGPESAPVTLRTLPEPPESDITGFGAVPDGKTLCTVAIQRAIDACPAGGLVRVPRGVFRTGALFLKSDMTLWLDEGARLLGSDDPADYPVFQYRWEGREQMCYASLLNTPPGTERVRNLTIAGTGCIDANGVALMQRETEEKKGCRGRALCLRNTDNLYLKDFQLRQSPAWCLHLIFCRHVSINHLDINSKYDEWGNLYRVVNADGIDPDSVSDLCIWNCSICSGDDCIAIKSGRDEEGRRVGIPSQDILIADCRFSGGFGVAAGSEMSGGIHRLRVRHCRFENVFSIGSIKAPRNRGGVIEDVLFEDCELRNTDTFYEECVWFRGALYVDQFYGVPDREAGTVAPVSEGTPKIRDIRFRDIRIFTTQSTAVFLRGLPEQPLEQIVLENVLARGRRGIRMENIRCLTLRNVTVCSETGETCFWRGEERDC